MRSVSFSGALAVVAVLACFHSAQAWPIVTATNYADLKSMVDTVNLGVVCPASGPNVCIINIPPSTNIDILSTLVIKNTVTIQTTPPPGPLSSSPPYPNRAVLSTAAKIRLFEAHGSSCVLRLEEVQLIGGTADQGGALYVADNATAYLQTVASSYNTATKAGGAVYVNGATLDVKYSTFENNQVLADVSRSVFEGGAVAGRYAKVNFAITTFQANKIESPSTPSSALHLGMAVSLTSSDASFFDVNFNYGHSLNSQASMGGAIHVAKSTLSVNQVSFLGNKLSPAVSPAMSGGGAIAAYSHSTIYVIFCGFDENDATAQGYGGALYVSGSTANLCRNNFVKNTAKPGTPMDIAAITDASLVPSIVYESSGSGLPSDHGVIPASGPASTITESDSCK